MTQLVANWKKIPDYFPLDDTAEFIVAGISIDQETKKKTRFVRSATFDVDTTSFDDHIFIGPPAIVIYTHWVELPSYPDSKAAQ